jgi:hypothetical protein
MLAFYKLKHENGIKKQQNYAPAILSSFDLSFTIHSSQSQSHDTIPLNECGRLQIDPPETGCLPELEGQARGAEQFVANCGPFVISKL